MSDDDSGEDESVTVADLGDDDGHTSRKGRFNSDGSDDDSSDGSGE